MKEHKEIDPLVLEIQGKISQAFGNKIRMVEISGQRILVGNEEGPIANGSRIRKVNSEPGDTNKDGVTGTVIGALLAPPGMLPIPEIPEAICMYWVVWDHDPLSRPIAILNLKVEELKVKEVKND